MKRAWLVLIAAVGAPLLMAETAAPQSKKGLGFDDFRLVRTRNIFDPNRRSTRVETAPARSTSAQPRPNVLALTGTMVFEGRTLAFFSGSRLDYNKIISAGESVADFKVVRVTPIQVELLRDGKSSVLAVGHQIALEGSSAAPASTSPTDSPEAAPAAPVPPADAPTASAPPATNDKTEIMRRLMERRQKEISK
jgi:hypothetical protein